MLGAVAGGLMLGIGEIVVTGYLVNLLGFWVIPYRPVIPLVIMSLTLLLAPEGITGVLAGQARRRA